MSEADIDNEIDGMMDWYDAALASGQVGLLFQSF